MMIWFVRILLFQQMLKPDFPDLIIVADTLVYLGDLRPFFAAVSVAVWDSW